MTARRGVQAQSAAQRSPQPDSGAKAPQVRRNATRADSPSGSGVGVIFNSLTEKAFQGIVLDALRVRGFDCFVVPNMRMTRAGLPDVIALRPGLLVFLELKRERRFKIGAAQHAFIDNAATIPGAIARIVRPSGWRVLLEEIDRMTDTDNSALIAVYRAVDELFVATSDRSFMTRLQELESAWLSADVALPDQEETR